MGARRRRSDARRSCERDIASAGLGGQVVMRGRVEAGRSARLVRGGDVVRSSDAVRRQLASSRSRRWPTGGGRRQPRGRIARQGHSGRDTAGWCRPATKKRWPAAIAKALADRHGSWSWESPAARSSSEEFSWRAATDRLLDLYRELLAHWRFVVGFRRACRYRLPGAGSTRDLFRLHPGGRGDDQRVPHQRRYLLLPADGVERAIISGLSPSMGSTRPTACSFCGSRSSTASRSSQATSRCFLPSLRRRRSS